VADFDVAALVFGLRALTGAVGFAVAGLFSNMEDRLSLTLPTLSSDDYAAVSDGKTRLLYVWGTIEYRDFFGFLTTLIFVGHSVAPI
jgi:hypothetical protein